MPRFTWIRSFGTIGSIFANVLVVLTTNWALTLSAVIAIWVGLKGAATAWVLNPGVEAGAGAFLFLLWSYIGICFLIDRRKPRLIQTHQDYRYGLTYEGLVPNYTQNNSELPEPGGLQFYIQVRNNSPGSMRYVLENVDIRIGSRTIPKYTINTISGHMARGAVRQARPVGFKSGTLAEFFGKGLTEGTADFSICYGPPEGSPVRRLKLSTKVYLVFPKDGAGVLGYADAIISEQDEPINTP
jgi:hypothetical protein